MAAYTLRKNVRTSYEETLARLPEALKSEGFGVLTEIDVKDTLEKKLGVDFRRYRILGACNPPLAHRAIQQEIEIGVMMPCNLVVYEGDDGATVVAAVDPMRTIGAAEGAAPAVREVAREVREKLGRVLDRLE